MTKILHQLGFRHKWNMQSMVDDFSGDGVICGPRHMAPNEIASIPHAIRTRSLFDPQFFVPNSNQGKLPEYDFFPNVVSNGFETGNYGDEFASESAKRCLDFQLKYAFESQVIPTRQRDATPSDFIESQMAMFVEPFLTAAATCDASTNLMLQLVLNDSMIKDDEYRNRLLNWVTGIPEISGIYLIPYYVGRKKQVADIDYLVSLYEFIEAIRGNEMDIVIGYSNTEASLLMVPGPSAVTLGSYENLRMFNPKNYENDKPNTPRGPNARIYISSLMQWVNHNYLGAIQRAGGENLIDDSPYKVLMFEPSYNWHFTKPEPYLHYFSVFSTQLKVIRSAPLKKRAGVVQQMILTAMENYQQLEESGIVFEPESSGSHLAPWATVLNTAIV